MRSAEARWVEEHPGRRREVLATTGNEDRELVEHSER